MEVLKELYVIADEVDRRIIALVNHMLILLGVFRSASDFSIPLPISLSYFDGMPVVSMNLTIDVHDLELITFLADFELKLLDYRSEETEIQELERYNRILERIALYGLSKAVAPILLVKKPIKGPRIIFDRFRFAIEEEVEELEGYRENLKRYKVYGRPPQTPKYRDVRVFYDPAFLALLAGAKKGKSKS